MSYNPPSGPASPSALGTIQLSGDLSGAARSPKVAKINGTLVEGSPTAGAVLTATSFETAQWQTPPQSNSDTSFTPQQFGAIGDGATDDTDAMQHFFDAVFSGTDIGNQTSHYGFIPDGTYLLSRAIIISPERFTGARIQGASMGGTILLQTANNTPIVELAASLYSHTYEISHLQLKYKTPQTSPGKFAALYMSNVTADGYFNMHYHHLNFKNCARGIASDPDAQVLVWGIGIDNCVFDGSNRGAFVYFMPQPASGQPIISIKKCYYNGQAIVEPAICIGYCESAVFESLEGNNSQIGQYPEWSIAQCNISIVACKSEAAKFQNNTRGHVSLWEFTESQIDMRVVTANGCDISGVTSSEEVSLLYVTGNLPWETRPSSLSISCATVGIDKGVVSDNVFLVGGTCQLALGSASLRNGCKKHTATVSLVSNLFSI